MIRIFFINICGTIIAENGEKKEEVGGDGTLEAKDEEDEDKYVEEQGDGEDAALEAERLRVEVDDIDMGLGGQGAEKG